jgi:hypothetical protein
MCWLGSIGLGTGAGLGIHPSASNMKWHKWVKPADNRRGRQELRQCHKWKSKEMAARAKLQKKRSFIFDNRQCSHGLSWRAIGRLAAARMRKNCCGTQRSFPFQRGSEAQFATNMVHCSEVASIQGEVRPPESTNTLPNFNLGCILRFIGELTCSSHSQCGTHT